MSGQLSPDVQQITAPTYKHAAQIRPGTVLVVASAITGPAWLLVIGLLGPAFKDLWQHRRQYVAGTRWWAPFCCTVDLVASALLPWRYLEECYDGSRSMPSASEQQMLCLLAGGRFNAEVALVDIHWYVQHTEGTSRTQAIAFTPTDNCANPTWPHPSQRIHPPPHLWVGTRFPSIGYAEPVDDTGQGGADDNPTLSNHFQGISGGQLGGLVRRPNDQPSGRRSSTLAELSAIKPHAMVSSG